MSNLKKVERLRLRTIASYAKGDVLDIGYYNIPNPYLNSPIGIDLKLRKTPKNYKKVFKGNCENLSIFQKNSFDTVAAGEVIEHIFNIEAFLGEIRRILRKDGYLILSTPNPYYISEIIANWLFRTKVITCTEHIYLFAEKNIENLLKMKGFKLVKEIRNGSSFPFFREKMFLPFNISYFLCRQIIYLYKKV